MHIDNARELKASLLATTIPALNTPAAAQALGVRSRAVKTAAGVRRTLAIGIAPASRGHKLALRLQQASLLAHPSIDAIRKRAKGELDIRFVGRVIKLETPATLQKRRRPLVIGCSIGHVAITAGTLGCFVTDRKTGASLILSNNHVLANENAAAAGDAILQPGSFDKGKRPKDVVATLTRFVTLKPAGVNIVDAAVAEPKAGIAFDGKTLGSFGVVTGLGNPATNGLGVMKVGRTTGETQGRVTAFELDNVVVAYDIGNLRFDDQVEVEGAGAQPFSQGGDSGSLIVDEERRGVALLFAGGDTGGSNGMGLTYGNPLHRVLDMLKVDLLP